MLCIQCALQALVEGKPVPQFEESPEDHQARVHPDLQETREERRRLEWALEERLTREERQQRLADSGDDT